eukprot:TRINITY_DN225_c0_g1_i4.p1 TRINITY_DN225_c0_g1~~TRINITY_DN225_c0_g1_i4.p1  ORF type:complete len:636 (-),score=135.64 TRINITY_DN225_c0_g1_i4:153-2060(-)
MGDTFNEDIEDGDEVYNINKVDINENEDVITESLDVAFLFDNHSSSSSLSEQDASNTTSTSTTTTTTSSYRTTTKTPSYTPKSTNKKTTIPRTPKPIPDFKKIPGTEFLVDGFQFKNLNNKHYFLSHFHSDHYQGITKTWDFGNIYCSEITARLVKLKLGVNSLYIKSLPMNTLVTVEGVEVMFLDANHCPGSVLILFRNVDNGKNILHTGDFRYHPKMKMYEGLLGVRIDTLYLDTTFCDPKYTFPPQKDVIQSIVDIVISEISTGPTLFLIGTYVIGKERIYLEISKRCHVKIYVVPDKHAILSCLDMDMNVFTTTPNETNVHVVPMGFINFKSMRGIGAQNSQYKKVVGFLPTGWSQSPKTPITKKYWDNMTIYNVAYSEHSSYDELKDCVKWLRPSLIVPTVDAGSQESVDKQLAHFKGLTNDSTNFKTIIPYLFGLAKKTLSFGGDSSSSSSSTTTSSQHDTQYKGEENQEIKKEQKDFTVSNNSLSIVSLDQKPHKPVEDKVLFEETELIDFSYVDPKILSQQRWIEKCINAENNKKAAENKSKRRASVSTPSNVNTKQTPSFNSTTKKKALENKDQQIVPFTPLSKKIKSSYPQTPTSDKENRENNESPFALRQTNILSFFEVKKKVI